jgi:2-isopropylmalate synthase
MSTDKKLVSPYVAHQAVRDGMSLPDRVTVTDCTTREGEQASDVNLSLAEKMSIIRRLAEVGIHQVQAGYPAKSEADAEAVRIIKREGLPIKVDAIAQVYKPDWRQEIDATLECEPDIIDVQLPSSDLRLQYVIKMTREELLDRAIETIEYTRLNRPNGVLIRFAPTDTTRIELGFLKQLCAAALRAGADRLTVADTAGIMIPAAMKFFVGELTAAFDVPIEIHCHDDCGLALANTLAALEAGAQIVDGVVNGLGERAGNAPLDELVMALELFYNFDLGIKTEALYDLSRFVADLVGVPVPVGKAFVGESAYAHKLDGHVEGILIHPPLYEPIPPEAVGNRRRIPIGKYTGPSVVQYKLGELGLVASEDQIKDIAREVEAAAAEKKASLSDAEFRAIAYRIAG